MAKASTKTGLKVVSSVMDAVYEIGRKASDEFKQQRPIISTLKEIDSQRKQVPPASIE